jgi:hypothetical protein
VAEAMMSMVVTLAAASYGHFGVTLKDSPALHRPHAQRSQPVVQRIPARLAVQPGALPCHDETVVAERTVAIRAA